MNKTVMGWVTAGMLALSAGVVSAAPAAHHHRHHLPVERLPVQAAHMNLKEVHQLPRGAILVKRNGKQYFLHSGAYYRWVPSARHYLIVLP